MKRLSFSPLLALALLLASCSPTATAPEPAISTNTTSPPTDSLNPPTAIPEPSEAPEVAGPRIVFASNRGEDPSKQDLYILDLSSNEITALNTGFDSVILPKWSPDGTRILFAVPDIWNLYIINADGTGLTQLTDFSSNNGDWSPDGTQIVFQSDAQNEPKDTPDIYRIDADGSNLVELFDNPALPDFNPRWADGKIMFISALSGSLDVFIMNEDGTGLTQVTEGGAPIFTASISPDGEWISFVYPQGGNFTDLYVIDSKGSEESVVRLTNDATIDDSPSWTPEGKSIVYSSDKGGAPDIWMINADGTDPIQLTADDFSDNYPDYWAPTN